MLDMTLKLILIHFQSVRKKLFSTLDFRLQSGAKLIFRDFESGSKLIWNMRLDQSLYPRVLKKFFLFESQNGPIYEENTRGYYITPF